MHRVSFLRIPARGVNGAAPRLAFVIGDDLGAPWAACWSPRLVAAVDQLCGEDRWEKPGLGWWVINFPARGGAGAWHVDGAHFAHTLASPEIGLAPMLLFSDVAEGGGGTALAPGSHRAVAAPLPMSTGHLCTVLTCS